MSLTFVNVKDETETLEPIWTERAKVLLDEDIETKAEKILELKKLVRIETDLEFPEDDGFYLMFLRGGKMDPGASLTIIKNFVDLRTANPSYFKGSYDLEGIASKVFSEKIHAMLPHRDQHGRRVYVFRPGRWDPEKIPFTWLFCAGYMLCAMVAREERTQIAGITSVTDATGFGMRHVMAMGVEDGRNLARFFNISFPLWLRQTHILNAPRFFNMVMNMVRPFLSENVKKEIVFHSSLDTLHQYISPDILPSDMGGNGTQGPMDNAHNVEELLTMEEYFKDGITMGYKIQS